MDPKYPHITVSLVGSDSNAFAVLAAVRQALKKAGVPKDEIDAFTAEATSGNYDHLLQTAMATVEVN